MAAGPGQMRRPDHAGGRAAFHDLRRLLEHGIGCEHSAARLHDQQRCTNALLLQAAGQRTQVAAHGRSDIRIDDGRAGPFVFPDFGQHLKGRCDEQVRQFAAEDFRGRDLVRGIGVGMEKRDCDRLDPVATDVIGSPKHVLLCQRCYDFTPGTDSLQDLQAVPAGSQGLRLDIQGIVEARNPDPAQLEEIPESLRRDQRGPGTLALEYCVRRNRAAMENLRHLLERKGHRAHHRLDSVDDGGRVFRWRGQRFPGCHGTGVRDEGEIGEGSTDIRGNPVAGPIHPLDPMDRICPRLPRSPAEPR